MLLLNKTSRFFAAAALTLAAAGALAQAPGADTVLMEGAGQRITLGDVQGALLRVPPEQRQQMLGNKGQLAMLVNELFSRRVLAQQARNRGLDQGAEAAALRRIAEDAALSDLAVLAIDVETAPSDKQLTERARALYDKDSKPFQRPAGVHTSHILIRPEGDKEAARQRAEEVLAKVRAGGDFAALARELSEDPGSALRGGDLGFAASGRMVQPYEEAVSKLKPGETSGLVESGFGYHIIRLHERRAAGVAPFEEVRPMLEARVRGEMVEEGRQRELQRLMKDALIKGETLDQVVKANAPAVPAASAPASAGQAGPAAAASASR